MKNGTSLSDELSDMETEQTVIGLLIHQPEKVFDVCGILAPEDFFWPIHGDFLSAILDSVKKNQTPVPATIGPFFKHRKVIFDDESGEQNGHFYLAELARVASTWWETDPLVPARIVADFAERRRILAVVQDIGRNLKSTDRSAQEIASDICAALSSDNRVKSSNVKTKKETALAAAESIALPPDCYETGLSPLNRTMGGGLYAGFTYGLAGAEKRGKTTLAHTISYNLNERGVLHAYIALEMGSVQIEQRNLARMLGINSLKFLQPGTREDSALLSRITQAVSTVKDSTLYLDMPGATLEDLQIELSKLVMKHKIKGFILDYWQLVEGQSRGETEERHLRRVAQWLANFARKNKIWCILLSQVNDEGKLFAGKGLVKACDQLYTIELAETESEQQEIWLRMSHSRYTPLSDVGGAQNPLLFISNKSGPFIDELNRQEQRKKSADLKS